ncbi:MULTISPECIES: hypothetical protein [unclassified Bacillus (in: firmicutes)]|uniref:hypothetical protein n=1 Tax=unclassified Bacillus (in: firmicutes) TaxID=185979 RepID=UPI00300FBAC4
MKSWIDTYPHKIHASVLLLENEIHNWKVGENYWTSPFSMKWSYPFPVNVGEYIVKHNTWIVDTPEQHSKVFQELAPEWMKQWVVAKDYVGDKSYK